MLFNSFSFLYFFIVTYAACLATGKSVKAQNLVLLGASWFFYGSWDGRFLLLLIGSSTLDYVCARGIDAAGASERKRRGLLWLSISANLTVLGVFKYFDFFSESAAALLHGVGIAVNAPTLGIVLPVGVSFYTFQIMGYVIDVYRRRVKAERHYVAYALFVAFFPQLVAGPIERAADLLAQIKSSRVVDFQKLRDGAWLLLLGYFKKAVVADNLAPFVMRLKHGAPAWSGGEYLTLFYAMVFYVYADFSGYSDIARGLGKVLGFELRANFRMPFFAKNPPDFWRRWNITLSDWFRDYVFTPMTRAFAKEKRTRGRLALAAFLTLTLCGLWHGASWSFVAFGVCHGTLMVGFYALNRQLAYRFGRGLWRTRGGRLVKGLFAYHLLSLPVIFFFVPRPSEAWIFVRSIFVAAYTRDAWPMLSTLALFGLPLLLLDSFQEFYGDALVVKRLPAWGRTLVYATAFALVVVAGETGTHAFVYFQF